MGQVAIDLLEAEIRRLKELNKQQVEASYQNGFGDGLKIVLHIMPNVKATENGIEKALEGMPLISESTRQELVKSVKEKVLVDLQEFVLNAKQAKNDVLKSIRSDTFNFFQQHGIK